MPPWPLKFRMRLKLDVRLVGFIVTDCSDACNFAF